MNIKEVLKIKSATNAKLIAGHNGIFKEVTGVNVLEALDIENWGKTGELILTSYFALQDLDEHELDVFFEKLHSIKISAIIIKIERLVNQIPNKIIELCNKYEIPLIQINKEVKYESIILEVLGPIVDRNIQLLNKYYEVHSELTRLALKMPKLNEVLYELKKMINHDISLLNKSKGTEISTNPMLSDVTILNRWPVENQKYMQFKYERNKVIYNKLDSKISHTQICVHISSLGYNDYELIIHELNDIISSEDIMVIENAVKFLQIELLKKYITSQNITQQKSNIIGDLLNDRFYEKREIDEVLESLNIIHFDYYQIIIVKLYPSNININFDKSLMLPILLQIRKNFRLDFHNMSFMEKSDRIVFIFNLDGKENGVDLDKIKDVMSKLEQMNLFNEFCYKISISSKVKKYHIPRANKEALDTQKILNLFSNTNSILSYDDLGIYKLFLESNNLDNLEIFISPKIKMFKDKYPQFFSTLVTFLDLNQSFVHTSQTLYLHPKTVRYRIEKIKELLDLDFSNTEEILQIQLASRLFKLIRQEEKKNEAEDI